MMAADTLRIGIVGLGANTRLRHVPGLLACENVELLGVANRRAQSTAAAAREFNIPRTYERWEALIDDRDIDAVMIGTWPYLHAPITLAALAAGKHVLTEARMATTLDEARQMLQASRAHPELVTQIVPSPFGLRADRVVRKLLADGYLGNLQELIVLGTNAALSDPAAPLHWRQIREYSGINMLSLGILHETLVRWVPHPSRVQAQRQTFVTSRPTAGGESGPVETPDAVHVLTELPGGARGIYRLSGAARFGPGSQIHLYGSEGTLQYWLAPEDKLLGAREGDSGLAEIDVPADQQRSWQVEADFVNAIRGNGTIELTDFESGVRYMEFTDAVARSAESGQTVDI